MEESHRFKKFHTNTVIDFLYNERLNVIVSMIGSLLDTKATVLDVGCATGYLSRYLSLKAITIGIEVNKHLLIEGQKQFGKPKSNSISFVCADLSHLPFRSDSADVVICASVLEHIENLDGATKQIEYVLKKDKILVAGYPIETVFQRALIRILSPKSYWCVNQKLSRTEPYSKCVDTHKQTFQTIRAVLRKSFVLLKKTKIPLDSLPDCLSIYECVKMVKRSK